MPARGLSSPRSRSVSNRQIFGFLLLLAVLGIACLGPLLAMAGRKGADKDDGAGKFSHEPEQRGVLQADRGSGAGGEKIERVYLRSVGSN